MSSHKGKPSGIDRTERTGTPSNYTPATRKKDHRATRAYTYNDERVADHIRSRHPNRNVAKSNPTNAGGYRN